MTEDSKRSTTSIDRLNVEIKELERAKADTRMNSQMSDILNKILRLALEDIPLEEMLAQVIKYVINASYQWITLEAKGAVFLVEDDPEVLVLKAQTGLAEPLLKICAKVPFGRCLCGRAALSGKTEFADCLDDHHENTYDGISPHGHYCVPIMSGNKVLGVLNLYSKAGHVRSEKEEGFLSAVADALAGIIERKKMEQALSDQQERLSAVIDTSTDAIISIDSHGNIISWSPAAEILFGYSADETIGEPITLIQPEKHINAHLEGIHRSITTEKPMSAGKILEVTALNKDNKEFPIEISLSTWKLEESRYFTAFIRDITRRKELESALKKENENAEKSQKELQEAYADLKQAEKTIRHEFEIQKIINELLNIFQANVPLNVMLETTIAFLTSIPWLSPEQKGIIFLVEDEPGMLELKAQHGLAGQLPGFCARVPFGKCLCGRAAVSGNVEFSDRLDECHDITYEGIDDHGHYCVPIPSVEGELLGVLNLYTEAGHKYDDREVEVLMAIAKTLAAAIERRKMEKTLSGQEEQLRQAYMDLKTSQAQIIQQEKMASIGQLAAGVAHEINNPVGFIASNLNTLMKYSERLVEFIQELTETTDKFDVDGTADRLKERRKQLKIDYMLKDVGPLILESLEGTERVKNIVQNLKSFSRLDEAQHKMADMNECMESTLNIIWNELKYKATVKKEYGEIPLTKCYPQQLNQVFMNLLVNAVQAIEKQGDISIKTWSKDGLIYILISDTGNGIPEDRIDKIFEPFFTTKEVGTGTGLGLSITYDIVRKHGGDITVDSEVGKGTTFTVQIPIIEEK